MNSPLRIRETSSAPSLTIAGDKFLPSLDAANSNTKAEYETFIRNEFRRFFSCKPGQPCTSTMSLSQLGAWLRFNPYRPKERLGLPNLNFDDFMGFKAAFRNAIGRYFEDREHRINKDTVIKYDYPARGFAFPDNADQIIVVDPKSNEDSLVSIRTEVTASGYAEDVYEMMNKSGAGVDIDEFTAHMLKYYS